MICKGCRESALFYYIYIYFKFSTLLYTLFYDFLFILFFVLFYLLFSGIAWHARRRVLRFV